MIENRHNQSYTTFRPSLLCAHPVIPTETRVPIVPKPRGTNSSNCYVFLSLRIHQEPINRIRYQWPLVVDQKSHPVGQITELFQNGATADNILHFLRSCHDFEIGKRTLKRALSSWDVKELLELPNFVPTSQSSSSNLGQARQRFQTIKRDLEVSTNGVPTVVQSIKLILLN